MTSAHHATRIEPDRAVSGWPTRRLSAFPADFLCIAEGPAKGEPITDARDLVEGDSYVLAPHALRAPLAIMAQPGDLPLRIAPGSQMGRTGAMVVVDCALTFMDPDGAPLDMLLFVEVDEAAGTIAGVHVHPLDSVTPGVPLTLVTVDTEGGRARLAQSAAVSFTRGTRITMADGRQVPIETLSAGDRVLTRDNGPQEVRWIGGQTLRATGANAPITIAPGALSNAGPLVVSANHRLFIYRRGEAAGEREILVKAGLLVNGTTVTRAPGGFVDYVQILFDQHEVIFAEGIAAESLFLDAATRPMLGAAQGLVDDAPSQVERLARELGEADLGPRADPAEMLRRLSL